MTIPEIVNNTEHRPWSLPQKSWKFYQEWNRAIFLHWEVSEEELRKFVPSDMEIDLFKGRAWVSLVAFSMEKIRPKYLPAFAPISNFDEINIRTYVCYKGKPGVYFLSIEGGTKLSCQISKGISELPYRYSIMNRTPNVYQSANKEYNDCFKVAYQIGDIQTNKTALDLWLTERYALFQDTKEAINAFEIHHVEWPIHTLQVQKLTVNYPRFNRLMNNTPDRIAYSPGVQVVAWDKQRYRRV